MPLKIKEIYLKNWKVYQEEILQFDLTSQQNIWIIFGQNGYGKTSLLEAIRWCLYGDLVVKKNILLSYFNRLAVQSDPNLELRVEITLSASNQPSCNTQTEGEDPEGDIYLITRSAQQKLREETVYVEVQDPVLYRNGVKRNDSQEWIDYLLPRMCREFFFFDGVEIQHYAKLTHTPETKNAIERILGIPELKNLRDDSKKAVAEFQKELNQASERNQQLQAKNAELQEIRDQLSTKQEQKNLMQQNLEAARRNYQQAQGRAAQVEGLKGQLEELGRCELDCKRLKQRLYEGERKVEETLRTAPIPLLLGLVDEVVQDLQGRTVTTARRSGSVKHLRELLKSEICVCGRCLDEEARGHILRELEQLERVMGAGSPTDLEQDELRNRLVRLSRYRDWSLDRVLEDRDRLEEDLGELEQRINRLRRETQGVSEQEAQEIWRKVAQAQRDGEEYEQKLRHIERQLEDLSKRENQVYREVEQLAGRDEETVTLAQQLKMALRLYAVAEELILWRIGERKATIEEKTSEIHRRVTNKPEEYNGIEVRPDYTLGVRTVLGRILSPEILSAGEKEALAFAFITGLNLASNTAAPLVMDTPFGHLDVEHQRNIVGALPHLPSQVILLATDRDFQGDLFQQIKPHVAEIFHIHRLGATEDASKIEREG
ncbi:AAA family ATPase [Spirulina subsalsa FACHB-351]|uniref:Nuclease SbcCD subunit C n=1 Tax=Spirulina subsalsa FACHB-351 TaxID=234711 RepID=A0ABT3L0W6_9CYAN|nr:AAA family ATPase [Spirulina subsalsa]MCW6035151.1 AAA family ATPase [Spirulina subsalsa FACHB-351]